MSSRTNSIGKPRKPIVELSNSRAITIGIIGILIPIGIQDFAVRRFFWGSMHLISLLLCPISFLAYAFDGWCAGGSFCTQPPGIVSFLSSCVLGWASVLLVLNLFECVRLISSNRIMYSKKSFTITMTISTIIAIMAWFMPRLYFYYG